MPITPLMLFKRDQRRAVARGSAAPPPSPASGRNPNAPDEEEPYKELEWPLVKRILALMAPYRWPYALALVLNIVFTILDMLGPMFIRQLIDHDIPGEVHPLLRLVGLTPAHPAYWAIGLTIGAWGLTVLVAVLIMRFNLEFNRRIGRPGGDPEDVLAPVEPQLEWMRNAGLCQVDCQWRWRGFALLVGQAPRLHPRPVG